MKAVKINLKFGFKFYNLYNFKRWSQYYYPSLGKIYVQYYKKVVSEYLWYRLIISTKI